MGQLDAAAQAPEAHVGSVEAPLIAAKRLACLFIFREPHWGQAGSSLLRTRISLYAPQSAQE